MEESVNYIFDDIVGETRCKFDGRLWSFENKKSNVEAFMTIPVKSISNIHFTKVRSWRWLIALILSLVAIIIALNTADDEIALLLLGLAIVLGVIAVVDFIFSVKYTISIIPHSKIEQKIVAKQKKNIDGLYEALLNSLKK